MDLVKTYGGFVRKAAADHPKLAYRLINIGLIYETLRSKYLADKELPNAYKYLNTYAVNCIRQGLKHPRKTAWVNLFAPVELIQSFGLNPLSIEALSSFLSGFTCEDFFIDQAQQQGIAPTLCSYHKGFIGGVDSGVIPPAAFAATTSIICDGNVNTFRHVAERHHVPCYMLDIPEHDSEEAVAYVAEQLVEMQGMMEDLFHKKADMEELRRILERENQSKAYMEEFLSLCKDRYYPSTLTINMYMLFATHLNIGSPAMLTFFRQMRDEVAAAPEFHGKKLLWVHLFPYYQETLQKYLNLSKEYQILTTEMNFDYREKLDTSKPFDALAKKMIGNVYNGPYGQKASLVRELAEELCVDGVINFCHWGCKQSDGGALLLKEEMAKLGMPLLILDGDGVDRRNSSDGQIRTRLEAFLEVIGTKDGGVFRT